MCNDIDKIIGSNVMRWRVDAGYTQKSFGAALPEKISAQQISKYERGDNPISSSRLVQFAQLLKCKPEELLEGAEGIATYDI